MLKELVQKILPKKRELVPGKKNSNKIEEKTNPGTLLELAIQKGMDMDKLSQLLEIYQKWETSKAKKRYYEDLSRFQSMCPEIIKRKRVYFTSRKTGQKTDYYYAPLDDIIVQVKELLDRCGFSYTFEQKQENMGKIKITCHLHHKDGHTESASLEAMADTSGYKNDIQSIASTVTYLRRYTFCGITGITTADQDDDAQSYNDQAIDDKKTKAKDVVYTEVSKKKENKSEKEITAWQRLINFINKNQKALNASGHMISDILKKARGQSEEDILRILKEIGG